MPVTAKDLARELNLSQPTVSRILSGDSNHRAAQATRERVLEAARRLGYQPNALASSLRRGRTGIIGLHTSYDYDVRNDFLGAIVGSLQRACSGHDLDVLLHSARSGVSAHTMFGKLRDGRVDGLILHAECEDPLVPMLEQSGLPVVTVADPLPGLAAVTSDDAGGMALLIEHLWGRGYRQFAFVTPERAPASVERRRHAFEAQLVLRGVTGSRARVHAVDYEKVEPLLPELVRSGAGTPLAVCCWNDRTAANLLRECTARGVSVPGTLAVAGFDGLLDRALMAQQLVTVACPWARVAETALDLLRQRIDADADVEPTEVCLPVHLIGGDTA